MKEWVSDISEKLGLPQDVALSGISISAVRKAMERPLPLSSSLEFAVRDMSAKRRTEFVAGRACVAQSFQQMGAIASFPLPVKNRLPVWPSGVLGSISHCDTIAVAMAAEESKYLALGVDVESLIEPTTVLDIQKTVCLSEELSSLARHVPCRVRALTLLFSAKEALYKALFPSTGKFEGFHSAELCSCDARSLVLRLTHDWAPHWRANTRIRVRHAWLGQAVVSAVCISRNVFEEQVILTTFDSAWGV